MKLRNLWLLFLVVAMVSTVLSCTPKQAAEPTAGVTATQAPASKPETPSGERATAAPSPTEVQQAPSPTARPTSAPTSTTEPEEEGPVEVGSVEELDSYRQTYSVSSLEDGEETGFWEVLTEFVREPRAVHTKMTARDPESGESSWETIQIGDTTYMKGDGEWMSMQSSEADSTIQAPQFLDPAPHLDSSECDYEGEEEVNGLQAKHYVCHEAYVTGIPMIGQAGQVLEAQEDTWVSTEYDVAVKTILYWKGIDEESKTVELRIESDATDINEDITIEAPEGVEKPGLPEDIPLIDGATNVSSIMGMTSFEVTLSAQEVADFYQEAMPEQGWTFKQDESMMPYMIAFEKAERKVSLMLGEEAGTTSVTIMVSEG